MNNQDPSKRAITNGTYFNCIEHVLCNVSFQAAPFPVNESFIY